MIPDKWDKLQWALITASLVLSAFAWALYWHWWAFFLFWFLLSFVGGLVQLIKKKGKD
jgi:hypothetical protein